MEYYALHKAEKTLKHKLIKTLNSSLLWNQEKN